MSERDWQDVMIEHRFPDSEKHEWLKQVQTEPIIFAEELCETILKLKVKLNQQSAEIALYEESNYLLYKNLNEMLEWYCRIDGLEHIYNNADIAGKKAREIKRKIEKLREGK